MVRFSSFAPHLGAALGAVLMLAASLAFNAGAGGVGADAAKGAASEPPEPPGPFVLQVTARAPPLAPGDAEALAASMPAEAPAPALAGPQLAVILDDVADLETARSALALPVPVTISVLPYAEDAPAIAALVRGAGRELFLHLPMEPVGLDDPGPYALTKMLDADAARSRAVWAFSRVPGATGFNNHMGSRLTADRDYMSALFAGLPDWRGLVFVDSLTSARSQAAQAARDQGFTALRRDVFLDNDRTDAAVRQQVENVLQLARQNGAAIAIAHPYPETLAVLAELDALAQTHGVRIVTVSELAAAREAAAALLALSQQDASDSR
jgi:polysaccharide deacetylase 2 family uncharacterized protein YibQ